MSAAYSPRVIRTAALTGASVVRRAAASREATAAPSAPVPQHRSTITGLARPASETAVSARNSLRRRGTNTPGSTKIRRPQNSAQPTTCSSGTPSSRWSIIASRSAGVRAASASSRASSSANTQPAARSRAMTAGSSSMGIQGYPETAAARSELKSDSGPPG